MDKQAGMTLIELVMVIVVLGILAAIAAPKFVDISDDAVTVSKSGALGAVKTAFAVAIADNQKFVDVVTLVSYIDDTTAIASKGGIRLTINGVYYTVGTYTDGACKTATHATSDIVKCVKEILKNAS